MRLLLSYVWPYFFGSSIALCLKCLMITSSSAAKEDSWTWCSSSSSFLWSANGSAPSVYCDMTFACKGISGGWMQVVKLDMTNSSHQCPPGTTLRTDLPRRLCGIARHQWYWLFIHHFQYNIIWNRVQEILWEDYRLPGPKS